MRLVAEQLARAARFEPRGRLLAVSRSLLALAGLSLLLSTPSSLLFASVSAESAATRCQGVRGISVWCASQETTGTYLAGTLVAVAILAMVLVGLRPRLLCVPHWYVAFSMSNTITFANGGEQIALILTGLMIPLCIGDRRTWQWTRHSEPLPATWQGSAYAAHLMIRMQILVIYLCAAATKLGNHSWRSGAAVGIILNDPEVGLPAPLRPLVNGVFAWDGVNRVVTWLVLAMEVTIGVSMLFAVRVRRIGMVLAVLLHSAIIGAMGLFSFGLIAIALLLAATDDQPSFDVGEEFRHGHGIRGTASRASRRRRPDDLLRNHADGIPGRLSRTAGAVL